MNLEVNEEPIANLAVLAAISIAFTAKSVFELVPAEEGLLGFALEERHIAEPYTKDYDAIDGEGPTRWSTRFDVTSWGLLLARSNERVVGGSVIAWNTPGIHMLEGRQDLAVLWDLRVDADMRGRGIGAALFHASEDWARARGCREMKVETQHNNVPACKFYEKQGCSLAAINLFAYRDLPDEIQLIWRKRL